MNKELPKAYEPGLYEDEIYKRWEESGFFNPDNLDLPADAPGYTIVLPPPNITDKLHLGHASMLAIEDLLIRYYRMRGYRALWLPGTDHAAIATQNVVEKKLFKEDGKTRHDLGREKFLEKVWEFLRITQTTILKQTRKMGSSLDWSRTAFTLDEQREKAVRKMFVDMYNEGVIYRGERIVNWCPRCHSTLADDEVEYKETKSKLYWIKYGPFVLATTRPETKLGDTAVAVHPGDKRYKDMVGKEYMIPGVLGEFKVKVIADHHVDPEFGSGAVKVTPAHSFADNEMARRNNIPWKQIINEDGRMMDNCGKYAGLTTVEAREEIVADMEKMGLIDHIEEGYENKLSVCYRCDTPIEPLPSKQWFVSVDKKLPRLGNMSLKEKAIEAAKKGEIKFIPDRFEKRFVNWMGNLHDWCISRQIWFGHRIPVWYNSRNVDDIYVGENPPEGEDWEQDPDSLDTWFSSGMWTFSTLGWPDTFKDGKKSGDLARFHPTQVLETGYEILTLWVSRMIMMSFFAVGEKPFDTVYLHGMVLDKNGKKMSKSKGNGIDPLDVIAKYGTDAVRLSLLIGSTPGNDVRIFEEKIEGDRNFVNKLWNVARFILQTADENTTEIELKNLTLADKWIMAHFNALVDKNATSATKFLSNYNFSIAAELLRTFTYDYLADWYLEAAKFDKSTEKVKVLRYVLENLLILWHPFIPFVTEKIWELMGKEKLLMVEKWPEIKYDPGNNGDDFELIKNIVIAIRNARAENKIEPGRKIDAVIYTGNNKDLIESQSEIIKGLRTGIGKLTIAKDGDEPDDSICISVKGVSNMDIYLVGAIDKDKEKKRLEKEIANLEKLIAGTEKKLANEEFTSKAPPAVVEKEHSNLHARKNDLTKLLIQLKQL
ncbi:valine--tRNA ligase [Candidatus Falkowbacteria bacterium RIFOXYC2_FULL_46_15]|uniref:Valine--tRNA ligase n=1 Tax=Candidatus Falkowbacteria bacterium RIFOXYA2_FULL_47_19 TaxID=1797994 RepID=A0A1F5SM02_9BACT|nr:MAG: valine--tRNA ligase [Candidatus Falkowbacteria bacterium RIFOXYA2_FULL_47_19]OGF34697.1 MAG: valine--tRNA ligase [Candidatus Falkowbacteria bacterium RIFOXYC2_FULL_46_15]